MDIIIFYVKKTSQFTTKCKIDCWVIALKQSKNQNNGSIIIQNMRYNI